MAYSHGPQKRAIKKLFEDGMAAGGLPEFKTRFDASIGLADDPDQEPGRKMLESSKQVLDYKDIPAEVCGEALMGPNWKQTFEQFFAPAAQARLHYESAGTATLPGELNTVSAAFDVFAGLVNARMLERPLAPEFVFDKVCKVVSNPGEGGFDIGTRANYNIAAQSDTDMSPGTRGPVVSLKPTRVHRNRPLFQQKRCKINWHTARNDLTGTIYSSVDEVADMVLYERERKALDCLMGVCLSTSATVASGETIGTQGLAMPISQDGNVWFPYQEGIYNGNAGTNLPSLQTQVLVQNYANSNTSNGVGLTDNTTLISLLKQLCLNRDPWTGKFIPISLKGMKFLIPPGSRPQVEYLLSSRMLWQIANSGFNTTGGTALTGDYNFIKELGIEIIESQYAYSRLVDVGVMKVSSAGVKTAVALTASAADTYSTAGSIYSAFYCGFFERAMNYDQVIPYSAIQVPLDGNDIVEKTISHAVFEEMGQAYWHQPRYAARQWA